MVNHISQNSGEPSPDDQGFFVTFKVFLGVYFSSFRVYFLRFRQHVFVYFENWCVFSPKAQQHVFRKYTSYDMYFSISPKIQCSFMSAAGENFCIFTHYICIFVSVLYLN